MPNFCPRCNRRIEGRRSGHSCDLALLDNGKTVHTDRIDKEDGDIHKQIEAGEVQVQARFKQNVKAGLTGKSKKATVSADIATEGAS